MGRGGKEEMGFEVVGPQYVTLDLFLVCGVENEIAEFWSTYQRAPSAIYAWKL